MLVLCMMFAALPVFAESTGETAPKGSGLGELLSGLLNEAEKKIKESDAGSKLFGLLDEAEKRIKESDAGSKLFGLLDELKKNVGEKASELMPKLKELMSRVLKDPTGKFAVLLSKIKEKLGSGDSAGLGLLKTYPTGSRRKVLRSSTATGKRRNTYSITKKSTRATSEKERTSLKTPTILR